MAAERSRPAVLLPLDIIAPHKEPLHIRGEVLQVVLPENVETSRILQEGEEKNVEGNHPAGNGERADDPLVAGDPLLEPPESLRERLPDLNLVPEGDPQVNSTIRHAELIPASSTQAPPDPLPPCAALGPGGEDYRLRRVKREPSALPEQTENGGQGREGGADVGRARGRVVDIDTAVRQPLERSWQSYSRGRPR